MLDLVIIKLSLKTICYVSSKKPVINKEDKKKRKLFSIYGGLKCEHQKNPAKNHPYMNFVGIIVQQVDS